VKSNFICVLCKKGTQWKHVRGYIVTVYA